MQQIIFYTQNPANSYVGLENRWKNKPDLQKTPHFPGQQREKEKEKKEWVHLF